MLASLSVPTSGSNCSEPKIMWKNAPLSMKPTSSMPSLPLASYRARRLGFESTWYASPTFWKRVAASGLSGFLSGCSLSASL